MRSDLVNAGAVLSPAIPASTATEENVMPAEPLAALFAELWELSLDGGTLDCSGVQDMLARTGLAVWREATEADVRDDSTFEVGDPLLALTEEGTRIVRAAREAHPTKRRTQGRKARLASP
jgi:hypothetical protein